MAGAEGLVGMAEPLATNRGTPLTLNLLPGSSSTDDDSEPVPSQIPEEAKRIIEDMKKTRQTRLNLCGECPLT
jgi:hypothetical protein